MTTDAAVEAMARALYELEPAASIDTMKDIPWERMSLSHDKYRARARAALAAALPHIRAMVVEEVLPAKPSDGLLMSMALRLDHAIGCPGYYDQPFMKRDGVTHARRVEMAISNMRKVYEEVAGQGYYRAEQEDGYRSALALASRKMEDGE